MIRYDLENGWLRQIDWGRQRQKATLIWVLVDYYNKRKALLLKKKILKKKNRTHSAARVNRFSVTQRKQYKEKKKNYLTQISNKTNITNRTNPYCFQCHDRPRTKSL